MPTHEHPVPKHDHEDIVEKQQEVLDKIESLTNDLDAFELACEAQGDAIIAVTTCANDLETDISEQVDKAQSNVIVLATVKADVDRRVSQIAQLTDRYNALERRYRDSADSASEF